MNILKAKPIKIWKQIRAGWQLYLLMLLPLIYVIVFKYFPMYGAQIAFKNFVAVKGILGSEWVGLRHFERFFHSYEFWRLINNTIGLSVYSLLAGFPIPIILALSLNYANHRFFRKMVQMITYAPHFISVVVIVGLILQFLDPRYGIVGLFLKGLGFEPVNFMAEPGYFKSVFVWSGIWQNAGFSCIIYLAALAGIDPTLHEAAVVDGASKLRRIWHIDLPGIIPVSMILLILSIGQILNVGFEKVLLMQNTLNLRTSEIIDTYVYKVGLVSGIDFSYPTAIGLFKSVIGMVLLVIVNYTARKLNQSSLW